MPTWAALASACITDISGFSILRDIPGFILFSFPSFISFVEFSKDGFRRAYAFHLAGIIATGFHESSLLGATIRHIIGLHFATTV
jgi:hypothetical protein